MIGLFAGGKAPRLLVDRPCKPIVSAANHAVVRGYEQQSACIAHALMLPGSARQCSEVGMQALVIS